MEIIEISIEQNYSSQIPYSKGNEDGIAYAMYLRRVEKKKNPILFKSTNDLLTVLKYPNSNIINAIGHSFLQIPKTDESFTEAINDLNALNDIQLSDIIINYCGVRSALTEEFHKLKGKLDGTLEDKNINSESKINLFETLLSDFRSELIKNYPGNTALIHECDRIIHLFDKTDITSIKNITTQTDSSLAITIPTEDEDASNIVNQFDWEVLMLDDNPNEINPIKEELSKKGIIVNEAYSVIDAKKKIEADTENRITVVISDYRLFREKIGDLPPRMQNEQGYDFLLWLSSEARINGMIALSGLSTQFLMESFRKYSIDVKVYSKTNIRTPIGLKMLFDEIIYLGDFNYDLICSKPSSKEAWKLMKPYYIKYRNTKGNYNIEQSITFKANEIIETIKEQVSFVHSLSDSEKNKVSLFADLQIDVIKGIAQSNFDNVGYSAITDDNLEKFYNKLIYRRVLIYFTIFPLIPLKYITKLLQDGAMDFRNDENDIDDAFNRIKKNVFICQALKEDDIPIRILDEEIKWLSSLGINVRGFKVELEHFYDLFYFFFSTYASKVTAKKFKEKFSNDKSLKSIERDLGPFLKDCLNTEKEKNQANKLLEHLKSSIEIMEQKFPQNDTLGKMLNKINKIQFK